MSKIHQKITQQINEHKILIYMKGTPDFPQCGFSAIVIEVFNQIGEPYQTIDVFEEPEIHKQLKSFSNWPMVPQVYINGKFVGGSDMVREMYRRGELQSLINSDTE